MGQGLTVQFTCPEAQKEVEKIPLEGPQHIQDETDRIIAELALEHVLDCRECQKVGLASMTGQELSCQKAIELWASQSSWYGDGLPWDLMTIEHYLALEHVMGWPNKETGYMVEITPRCKHDSCQTIANYEDGDGKESMLALLVRIFRKNQWSLDSILETHGRRVSKVMQPLAKFEFNNRFSADGHRQYLKRVAEIEQDVHLLHKLLLEQNS
ncbi:MAG: hypothetical protein HY092_00705 [Candidatus Kerfeldbacteria bacterium]|nr:hypothetical protein [Candidatus Kerfeldbacteria bacterium]